MTSEPIPVSPSQLARMLMNYPDVEAPPVPVPVTATPDEPAEDPVAVAIRWISNCVDPLVVGVERRQFVIEALRGVDQRLSEAWHLGYRIGRKVGFDNGQGGCR